MRLLWESSAPLDFPVVPEVNRISAGSSSSRDGYSGSSPEASKKSEFWSKSITSKFFKTNPARASRLESPMIRDGSVNSIA